MTFVKELREAARRCSNIYYAAQLRTAADELNVCLALLHLEGTTEAMKATNGAWANADRILKNVPAEGDPAPLAGAPDAALLTIAA